jgi:hypothetical protein
MVRLVVLYKEPVQMCTLEWFLRWKLGKWVDHNKKTYIIQSISSSGQRSIIHAHCPTCKNATEDSTLWMEEGH